ncbi:hypothetical protein A8C32_03035 [Flavivirga aquatica]|uniref:thioredoxin-dependent peroxiredoxin n=1 Tax=Flavivirga aquatica TaxID=1849968 RepID=A0A1E5TAQ9_9FLAO|nr:peroxiredoxin-like family protein [Flavivirga aquatica]OEK08438.1 hypothetical protein A8C32_03035 [Flavivirga aquatica]
MNLSEQLSQMRNNTLKRMPQHILKVFIESIESIKQNKVKEKVLQKRDVIPNIYLKNLDDNSLGLNELDFSDFLILNFYRGGWCPYCNMELREYERLKNKFTEIGVSIVAISAEIPELAAQTSIKNGISFPILTDVDAKLMKTIGIVFELDENSKREYGNFGLDLTKIHGNDNYELPVPAIYVVDKNMKIVFIHFEENYMTRLEPQDLLNTLKKITIKH